MNVAKNAMKDLRGKVKKTAGALSDDEQLKKEGEHERREAIDKEISEEVDEGRYPAQPETAPGNDKFAMPDFEEDSNVGVDEVTTPEGHSR